MNKKMLKRILFAVVSLVLIAAMALCMTSCKNTTNPPKTDMQTEATDIGQGSTQFKFEVYDADGKATVFHVSTDKTTVGDALLELNLIEGDQGDYGLYVKKVNGIVADYDADKTYWAFYVNGEYAMSGVDATNIEAGATYAFKIEK